MKLLINKPENTSKGTNKKVNYVITITAMVNLTQNRKEKIDHPEIEVSIKLKSIDIHL